MNRGKEIRYFIIGDLAKSSGFQTRIKTQVRILVENDYNVDLFCIQKKIKSKENIKELEYSLRDNGLKTVEIVELNAGNLLNVLFKSYCFLTHKESAYIFVGVKTQFFIPLVKLFGVKEVIVDKHGIIEEIPNKLLRGIYSVIEKITLPMANKIIVVSQKMLQYCTEKKGWQEKEYFIVPCLANGKEFYYKTESRERLRRELQLEDRIVFVYSGIFAHWQCPKETIKLFINIRNKILPNAYLLIISPDKEKYQQVELLQELDETAYKIISLKHEDIPDYLSACDVGMLLRDSNQVNEVSSPVKFAEYLLCGLPVIIGDNVGDYSDLINSTNNGMVINTALLDSSETVKGLAKYLANMIANREMARLNAMSLGNKLTWESGASDFLSVFK